MFETKSAGRTALRSLVTNLGAAAALSALDSTITEYQKMDAYGRGRRTLQQQPWIHCREAVRQARKEATDRAERKASADVKVTATDKKTLSKLVQEFSPNEVCAMVTQVFKDVDLTEQLELCNAAVARHADRRSKFACPTEQRLGIETLKPEAKE